VITDSVRDRILVQADSGIRNSLCPNASATSFNVTLTFDQCTGIVLDSLKQVTASPSFTTAFRLAFLGDTTMQIPFTYRANRTGWDTAHYRLRFHSLITGNIEQKFFSIAAFGTPGSPELNFSPPQMDFPQVFLDSVSRQTASISNPGCDTLIVDTIFSTNPAIFQLSSKPFPVRLAPGKSLPIAVTFNPHLEGDYLESLVIETNAGNRNITVRGSGKAPKIETVSESAGAQEIRIYPNPANSVLAIHSDGSLPREIILYDLLGSEIMRIPTGAANEISVDIHSLSDGLYIFAFGGGKYERIVIRH
jgi:hypothetical protein